MTARILDFQTYRETGRIVERVPIAFMQNDVRLEFARRCTSNIELAQFKQFLDAVSFPDAPSDSPIGGDAA